jgi:hypothetical protein
MKVPLYIQALFENESTNLQHGKVVITAIFRNGKARFSVDKNISVYVDDESSIVSVSKNANETRGAAK